MTEEEIIKDIEDMLNYNPKIRELSGMEILSISKLLKLCNKQKEKIKSLETENKALKELYSGTQEFKDVCK